MYGAVLVHVFLFGVCSGRAAAVNNGTLNFVLLGDWGGQEWGPYFTSAEVKVAEQMGKKAAEIGSQFTVALGDNFYSFGVKNVDDLRFKQTYEDVYTADSLQSRWYVVCGNHDHYGNAFAQVAYTAHSKRWYMPDFYYTEVMTIPDTASTVQFVFIDTVLLAGVILPLNSFNPPPGPASIAQADQQWAWIEETLMYSNADWIIVAGHYPVWSIGAHGPTQILLERLRPLLIQYNVSVYFCGHDHNMQYIQEDDSSVSYVVTGAGSEIDPAEYHMNDIPSGALKFLYNPVDLHYDKGGFTTVSISSTSMDITFFDHEAAQEKMKELTAAVKGLAAEAKRLQNNLNRLHKFQASLLSVSQHWLEWMEKSNQLQFHSEDTGSSCAAANNGQASVLRTGR